MEIWQHLLILLISGSGLFWGALIGKYTKSEVIYAEKYLTFFTQLCGLLLFLLFLGGALVPSVIIAILFIVYVVMKSRSKKLSSLKDKKRLYLNYALFAIYGLLFGFLREDFILSYSVVVFLAGITVGSLLKVRSKAMSEYVIPFVIYVVTALIVIL